MGRDVNEDIQGWLGQVIYLSIRGLFLGQERKEKGGNAMLVFIEKCQ